MGHDCKQPVGTSRECRTWPPTRCRWYFSSILQSPWNYPDLYSKSNRDGLSFEEKRFAWQDRDEADNPNNRTSL